ncbi:hypothetical protein ACHAPE_008884 [Trichoderma viride]
MDDQYSQRQWALDMRNDLQTPPLPHDIRPERDTNRPEWDGTEYTPIQLQSDTNALEQDGFGHVDYVATRSDSDTLNAPDQDIYNASTTTTSIVKPKKKQSAWTRLSTTWWMEVITIFISTGFMIGLIAILASFQNRLTTEWTFFISINAVVAIVITAARATLLATVSVCLSQEKWNHFNGRARRLQDLNIIDRASRGPLGSIQMLFSVSWGVATVSAVVMILSLVTDSFVQQVVSFQPGTIYAHQDGSAAFGHAVSYSSGLNFDRGRSVHDGIISLNENTATNVDMQSAFFRGIWQTSWPSGVNCTSNCTWDQSYYTIGFTNTCADVTKETLESLQCTDNRTIAMPYANPRPCNLTTPHGLHFPFQPNVGGSSMAINSSGWDSGTSSYTLLDGRNLSRTAFWSWNRADIDETNMSVQLKPMLQNSTVVECTFGIVVYKYSNISFISNKFSIGATEKTPLGKASGYTKLIPPECVSNNCFWVDELLWWNNTSPDIPHISFSATDLSMVTRLFGSPAFSGSVGLTTLSPLNAPAGSTTAFGNGSLETVSGILDNVAQSLTDMMREKGAVQVAQGLTSQAVVYMRVQWLWLILPIALQVFGVLALIGALVGRRQTKDVPLWKGSALAVLYHSVDRDGVLGTQVKDLQELEDLGMTQVMLEKKSDGTDP